MIKPATLWGLFKTCDNDAWLGRVCRALGRQNVQLDYGQQQIVNSIQLDSDWLDEAVEVQREKWRTQKRGKSGTFEKTTESAEIAENCGKCGKLRKSRKTAEIAENCGNRGKLRKSRKMRKTAENAENSTFHCFPLEKRNSTAFHPSILPSIHNNSSGGGDSPARTRVCEELQSTPKYPADFKAIQDYLTAKGITIYDEHSLKALFLQLVDTGWLDTDGKPITSWHKYFISAAERCNVTSLEKITI